MRVFTRSVTPSAAAVSGVYAGLYDQDDLRSGGFREFRVSSVARWTSDFTPQTTQYQTDANTVLLWHFDDYTLGKVSQYEIIPTINRDKPVVGSSDGMWSDASGNGYTASAVTTGYCIPFGCLAQGGAAYLMYEARSIDLNELIGGSVSQCTGGGGGGNEAIGEFYDSFHDLCIPGRGMPLDMYRTYSSYLAGSNPTPQNGPLGYGWVDGYQMHVSVNPSNQDARVYAANGSSTLYTWNGTGYDHSGEVPSTLTKNGSTGFTLTDGSGSKYQFDSGGRLTDEVDRNGHDTHLTYDAVSGNLTTVADPSGRTFTFGYDSSGHIHTVSDQGGPDGLGGTVAARTVTYGYDANGNLHTVTNAMGGVTEYDYTDPTNAHLLTTIKDADCTALIAAGKTCPGSQVGYTGGTVVSQTDPLGRQSTFQYSGTLPQTTTTVTSPGTAQYPSGLQTVQSYLNYFLTSTTVGANTSRPATSGVTFDPGSARGSTSTDADGRPTTSIRDGSGNVIQSTDALGRTTYKAYNSFNEPTRVTDPMNVVTTYAYDANGNVQSTCVPVVALGSAPLASPLDCTGVPSSEQATTTYTYDVGNADPNRHSDLLSLRDANGVVTQ